MARRSVVWRFRSMPGAEDPSVFLCLPGGHAIVDPGAGQDLIGLPAFERLTEKLRSRGFRAVRLEETPGSAAGVGGKADTLFAALIPCVLGGHPGVVKVTVVKEDVPHLLSIGLLESMGSVIDTRANVLKYELYGAQDQMNRLKSGHRTIDITKWDGESFPVPQQLREQYGLEDGAFDLVRALPTPRHTCKLLRTLCHLESRSMTRTLS